MYLNSNCSLVVCRFLPAEFEWGTKKDGMFFSAGFWYFVDAVMQNVLARQTVLSMQLKEIKDSLLEGVHMRISEG